MAWMAVIKFLFQQADVVETPEACHVIMHAPVVGQ